MGVMAIDKKSVIDEYIKQVVEGGNRTTTALKLGGGYNTNAYKNIMTILNKELK